MPLIGHNWLNSHASRVYPLADSATNISDDGTPLPTDVITDVQLRWPLSAGAYAFVGGVTVTPNVITVVFLAADSPTSVTGFTPLAAVTVAQPAAAQFHALKPLYPGVGGFVAFGDMDEACAVRFSNPSQSLLTSRVAYPYKELPIDTIRKLGHADALSGLVTLSAGDDIEIVKDEVTIDDVVRDAIVIKLITAIDNRNILSEYIGPCGVRPESRNCLREGVETINGISPDCDGNIDIAFRNLDAAAFASCGGGVVLDQSLGIDDVCIDRTPTRFVGADSCASESASVSVPAAPEGSDSDSASDTPSSSSEVLPEESASSESCGALPFSDCFTPNPDDSWELKTGNYDLINSNVISSECYIETYCPDVRTGWNSLSSLSSVTVPGSSVSGSAGSSVSATPGTEIVHWSTKWKTSSSSACGPEPDYSIQLNDTSRQNILLWEDCRSGVPLTKHLYTQFELTNGPHMNAGIVMNYRTVDPITNPHIEYHASIVNRSTNSLQLFRFNGFALVVEAEALLGTPLVLGDLYQLETVITAGVAGSHRIWTKILSISDPSWQQVSFTVETSRYADPEGYCGIYTDRATTNFSYWKMEDV